MKIFQGTDVSIQVKCLKILKFYKEFHKKQLLNKQVISRETIFLEYGVLGFFNGASNSEKGGCGMVIKF